MAKARPSPINIIKKLKLGTEQLANLLKNIKVNYHNKALGHYRAMAWLQFQKGWRKIKITVFTTTNKQYLHKFLSAIPCNKIIACFH